MFNTNWPKDPVNGRYVCTSEKPMPKNAPQNTKWSHSSIKEIGPQINHGLGCETTQYHCTNCKTTWTSELPQ